MSYIEPVGIAGRWHDGDKQIVSYEIRYEVLGDVFKRLGYEKLSKGVVRNQIESLIDNAYSEGLHFSTLLKDKLTKNLSVRAPDIPRTYYNGECTVFPYTIAEDFCIFVGKSKPIVDKHVKRFKN